MIDRTMRAAAAHYWRLSNRNKINKNLLYRGENGIRSVTFHDIPDHRFGKFKNIVNWCSSKFRMAAPSDALQMLDGTLTSRAVEDSMLITFDDGHADNHRAAEWLNKVGIRASFFIVPSFVDRSNLQYLEYHKSRNVCAYSLQARESLRESQGLSRLQILEMIDMGHHIGAHNYAHRDLAKLDNATDLDYEIQNSVDAVEDMTGKPCRDFAVGFGQPDNLSDAALRYLLIKRYRTYMCFRGLNIPGISPRYFLRHGYIFEHPEVFTKLCLQNGADHKIHHRQESFANRVGYMPSCA